MWCCRENPTVQDEMEAPFAVKRLSDNIHENSDGIYSKKPAGHVDERASEKRSVLQSTDSFGLLSDELFKILLHYVDYFKQRELRGVSKRWNSILLSEDVRSLVLVDVFSLHAVVTRGITADFTHKQAELRKQTSLAKFEDPFINTIICNADRWTHLATVNERKLEPNGLYSATDSHEDWFRHLKLFFNQCPNNQHLIITGAENCFEEIDIKRYMLRCPLTVLKSHGWLTVTMPLDLPAGGDSEDDWVDEGTEMEYEHIVLFFKMAYGEIRVPGESWAKQARNYIWPYDKGQLVWLGQCIVQLANDDGWHNWLTECHFRHDLIPEQCRVFEGNKRLPTDEELEASFGVNVQFPPPCLLNPKTSDWWKTEELLALTGDHWLNVEDLLAFSGYIRKHGPASLPKPPRKFDFDLCKLGSDSSSGEADEDR